MPILQPSSSALAIGSERDQPAAKGKLLVLDAGSLAEIGLSLTKNSDKSCEFAFTLYVSV
jgi:hypothetical protein